MQNTPKSLRNLTLEKPLKAYGELIVTIKKNCLNCIHLEWHDADEGAGSGYCCEKRHDKMAAQGKETEFLDKLSNDAYLDRGKKCHEPRPISEIPVHCKCPECGDTYTGFPHQQGTNCFDCFAANAA